MRYYILVILCLKCACAVAQNANDTNDINVGITTYPFTYNTMFKEGSIAIGPSLFLNTDCKLIFQIGVLFDLKKYIYYYHPVHTSTTLVEYTNLFLPILFHYNYYNNNKIKCFLTAGFIYGGKYYLNKNNETRTTNGINFIVGTGIFYNIIKRLQIRAYPALRYSERNFFPGLLLDLSFSFSHNACL